MKFIKKHIKFIVFLVICVSLFLIYQKSETDKIVYVSIGDGFAYGVNSFGDTTYGYDDYLIDDLRSKKQLKSYYNSFSYSDMMIKDLYKDILLNVHDKDNNNIKQVMREANLLTISVGINDLIYEIGSSHSRNKHDTKVLLTKIVDNYDKMINEIKKYYQKDIYVIGYYNFYPQKTVEKKFLDLYNASIKEYCDKNNLIYVDNSNLEKNIGNYLDNPNSFYPNNEGYQRIYNNIKVNLAKKT